MSSRAYESYRDSGFEPIGALPAHWRIGRLKDVSSTPVRNGVGEASDQDDPDNPRYIRITDLLGPRKLRTDTFRSLPPDVARKAELRVGDMLFAAVGATFGKAYLHTEDIGPACFAGYLVKFSAGAAVAADYVAYWTESACYWGQVNSQVIQSTVQNFSAGKYSELRLPLPPYAEQTAIASFLDRETAKIDALVEAQRRLIELLKEKRQAVISHAVTKGLDAAVPMRNSGVEWLGEVPGHWRSGAVKWLVNLATSGPRGWSEMLGEDGAIFFQSQNIGRALELNLEGAQRVSPPEDAESERARLQVNDVLVCITGGRTGAVAHVDTLAEDAYINQHVCSLRARPSIIIGRFLAYALFSHGGQEQLRISSYGLKQGLALQDVKDQVVALPPIAEQEAIVIHLDKAVSTANALAADAEAAIGLLQERRSALISAAVTGKIDVRELAIVDAEAA